MEWPAEHSEVLRRLLPSGLSYARISVLLNEEVGANYTRNSCIGKARRMEVGGAKPARTTSTMSPRERYQIGNEKKREKRWAANPSLRNRAQRLAQQKATRALMRANDTPITSPAYRKHMPRLPEMTRGEMRAMLKQAVMNTAAMEVTT